MPLLDRREGARVSSLGVAHGQVAQLVEQGTENPRVGGSSPSLATIPNAKAPPEYGGVFLFLNWGFVIPLFAPQPRGLWLRGSTN